MSGRLPVDALLAALLAASAVLCAGGESPARRRIRALVRRRRSVAASRSGSPDGAVPSPVRWESPRARAIAAALAAVAAGAVLGGPVGLVAAPIVGVAGYRLLSALEPASVRRRRARMLAELPVAAELIVACLRAGRPVEPAIAAVSRALRGPLGEELATVAAALRVGADGAVAWARFVDDPVLAPVGRSMVRAWESGTPIADTLDRIADDARRERRARAEERARAVGVRAAAPLGLCFLPAFLLIGVAPVIIGTVRDLLSG